MVFLRDPLNSCTFRSKNRIVFFIVKQLLINSLLFCRDAKNIRILFGEVFSDELIEGECPMNVGE